MRPPPGQSIAPIWVACNEKQVEWNDWGTISAQIVSMEDTGVISRPLPNPFMATGGDLNVAAEVDSEPGKTAGKALPTHA